MLPSLIRAMTKKTWQYWWGDRKDYLPKELGNLPKNMVYVFLKWYKQLEGCETEWRAALICTRLKQPGLCGHTF